MSQQSKIEKVASHPITSILLTTVSAILPAVGVGKDMIDKSITKIQQDRFNTLLDELSNGETDLTEEIIQREEFIHSFVIIYKAVTNTYKREKIRYFARLLKSGIDRQELASDNFEEFTNILDDLSMTELTILKLLHYYELNHYDDELSDFNEYQILSEFWNEFVHEIESKHYIPKDELIARLARLNRTGLYRTFTGMNLGYKGDKGKTTGLFKKFAEWIELENDFAS